MVTKVLVQQTKNPDYPFLDTSRIDAVESYLSARNLLRARENVARLERTSQLSRNTIVRVVTNERSLVLKQFTEWSGDAAAAPSADVRFKAECQFHRSSQIASCPTDPLAELLHQDARGRCLLFEDIGSSPPVEFVPDAAAAESFAWFLVCTHHHTQSVPASARHDNWSVRQWLASKLFVLPQAGRRGHGCWLERLMNHSRTVRAALHDARIAMAESGPCLVHGDFLPRNWLRVDGRCRVVDAEFSFFGRPEFDAGALLAGLIFRGAAPEALSAAVVVLESGSVRYDQRFIAAFTGAHFATLLETSPAAAGAPSGSKASALLRRIARAIEAESLADFARIEGPKGGAAARLRGGKTGG